MRIHEDVITRLDSTRHRLSCANCEDEYCYDCILLEMTDAEYQVDTALLNIEHSSRWRERRLPAT